MKPLAPSGVFASRPMSAANHDRATTNSASIPAAATHSSGVASGRKPMRMPTPSTTTVDAALRATLATTCPARNAAPPTSSERRRSTSPLDMSLDTLTAVIDAP